MEFQRFIAVLMLGGSVILAALTGFAVSFGSTDFTGQGVTPYWYYLVVLNVSFIASALACVWIIAQRLDDETPRKTARYVVLFSALWFAFLAFPDHGSGAIFVAVIAYGAGAGMLALGLRSKST